MRPMSDVLLQNQLLVEHLCQAKSVFGPDVVKSLEMSSHQSEPKLEQFAAITPHVLVLNHSMPLVCDQ